MIRAMRTLFISGFVFVLATSFCAADLPVGIGAIGDSLTDEYQFADAGNHSAGRNWLEQLAGSRSLNFGVFTSTSRGEPRNQGYEYNWARAGATSTDLLNQGQLTGVTGQEKSGQVTFVCLMVGNNDFGKITTGNYQYIYNGNAWGPRVDTAINNVRTMVDTVLDPNVSGTVKLVLATIPDVELNPAIRTNFPDPAKRQLVRDAFASYNSRLVTEVIPNSLDPNRIAVADVYQLSLDWIAELQAGHNVFVGGYEVDLNHCGDDPNKIILADQTHPGTIPQGLVANEFINAMNEFGAGITVLSDQEILLNAGIPEPTALSLLALGSLALLRRRRT